ncbi:MAG: hypothetical protein H0U49_06605 [Parachlamydiaceae bacterium]|nr:hypothetical protein [Parachlamydiaceae bacterium]
MQISSLQKTNIILQREAENALKPLLGQIHRTIYQIIICRKIIFKSKLYNYTHNLKSDEIKLLPNLIEKNKYELTNLVNRFGILWNEHAKHLDKAFDEKREKLKYFISYLTDEENHPIVKYSATLLDTLQKLVESFFSIPKSEERCLKPTSFFGHIPSFTPIHSQQEILSLENLEMKQKLIIYLKNNSAIQLNLEEKLVFDYLFGSIQIDEMPITKKNARANLNIIKIIDQAIAEHNRQSPSKCVFKNSSFELRTHILKICSPLMTTAEAYTKTLDPSKFKERNYLSNTANWIPEFIGHHARITAIQIIKSMALSKQLNHYVPTIWAVRGNTASGKSTAIENDPCFSAAFNDNNNSLGSLTPDFAKQFLRKEIFTQKTPLGENQSFLVSNQTHNSESALHKVLMQGIYHEATNGSILIEGRFSTIEEFKDTVLNPAKARNGEVLLLDLQCPLMTSLYRVLARDPFTHQCPPLLEIVKGYKESIIYRKKLIEIVRDEPCIKYYKLYCSNISGQNQLVMEKQDGRLIIHSQILLDECCRLPSDDMINQVLDQQITDYEIDKAIERLDVPKSSRIKISQWKGISLAKALEMHVLGIPIQDALEKIGEEATWRKHYGHNEIHPFTGEWLQDFPEIHDHIKHDHLLDSRVIDDDGQGIHWVTNKFSWSLNPQFNPETILPNSKQGGFQMRIGYFIIPLAHVETFVTKNISPKVLSELEVHDEKDELIGYRFFVHPEAYAHFSTLHKAAIPFVKPQHSEFMGAPTSSYRSWVIRRTLLGQKPNPQHVPFIAKMGVSSCPTEVRRLLPKSDIEISLKAQEKSNQMPREHLDKGSKGSDLFIFPENFAISLKNIENYPPQSATAGGEFVDSGMIIREFPKELFQGCKFFSLAGLMSVARTKSSNTNVCALNGVESDAQGLPLIYEVVQAAIDKGLVKNLKEFIKTYLIDGYLNATEELYMLHGIPFAPHGQNLCFVLNPDNTPRGFAYRDMEGIFQNPEQDYLKTFSLYHHHIFIQLLNLFTLIDDEFIPPPIGAPTQVGFTKPIPERTIYSYIRKNIKHSPKIEAGALKTICAIHISIWEYDELLKDLDQSFLKILGKYFNLTSLDFINKTGTIPSAETGSVGEAYLQKCNALLWKNRYPVKLNTSSMLSNPIIDPVIWHRKSTIQSAKKLQSTGIEIIKKWNCETSEETMKADSYSSHFHKQLTPLGLTIAKRHIFPLTHLLQKGESIDHVSIDETRLTALDIFFKDHREKGSHTELLKVILNQKPSLNLERITLFYIAVYSSPEELQLLLEYGLKAKSLWVEKKGNFFKGPEINLLDFAVIQAERDSLFGSNQEAIKKVELLLKFGADATKCNHVCNQNYLHRVTDYNLRHLLCHAGVDVKASERAHKYIKKDVKICPMDLALDIESIDLYCSFGESRDNSPFLKETSAHLSALKRIGYDFQKGPNQFSSEGIPLIIKAVKESDYSAIAALLGEGADVNMRSQKGSRWTALHWLFSKFGQQSSSSEPNEYLELSNNEDLRLINIMIKKGALPLKDDLGRTPLMCLTFHVFWDKCQSKILDDYIGFEAKYFGINPHEYRSKFTTLRESGFKSVETLFDTVSVPVVAVFDQFWNSFKEHKAFDAEIRHDPNASWAKTRELYG